MTFKKIKSETDFQKGLRIKIEFDIAEDLINDLTVDEWGELKSLCESMASIIKSDILGSS